MQVKTKTMGTVEVSDEQLIKVPSGLFAFEDYKDYALIDCKLKPFVWMQSVQESSLAFLLIDPFLICDDFEADIDDKELAKIGIQDPSDVLVMAIVTVPQDGSPVTANFQGPLIINRKNHECMQVVLNDPKWTTKHNIVEALKRKEAEKC
ncbi:MAG: flagellar assembly protein FliW [Treponema sp.]|jgi:flagellar assembly factor FliW|nr:flagellar assembly protein FliW [Treponema sp.]